LDTLVINHKDESLGSAPAQMSSGKYGAVHLDLSKSTYVRSIALVRWRCLIDLAQQFNLQLTITPPVNVAACDYAGRMGVFDGTTYQYPHHKRSADTFFPLIRVENDRNDRLYDECRKIFSLSKATMNYVDRLADAFTELADNIFYHSGKTANSGWGYIHAQAYPNAGNIYLGISDVGVGFYGSYARTNQTRNRTEEQIIVDSFEALESSLNPAPKQGHRGLGLHEVHEFVKKHTGRVHIRSGKASVSATQVGIFPESLGYKADGTWIEVRVPIL